MTDCATRLTEAKAALHKLMTGAAVVTVAYNGINTQYTRANVDKLRAYIRQLEAECGDATGSGRRGAVMFRG